MNITNELYQAFNREYIKQQVIAITTQQANVEKAQLKAEQKAIRKAQQKQTEKAKQAQKAAEVVRQQEQKAVVKRQVWVDQGNQIAAQFIIFGGLLVTVVLATLLV